MRERAKRILVDQFNRYGLLRRFNFARVRMRISGRDVWVPMNGRTGLNLLKPHEVWITSLLKTLGMRRDGGVVVDVGANIGHTILHLVAAGSTRHYYGFEPNARAAAHAEAVIECNQLRNAFVLPTALSDRAGVVWLETKGKCDAGASIINGFRRPDFYKTRKPVTTSRGDDALADLGVEGVAIVKIDVEGGELEVLRGLRQTLAAHKPYVICEVLPIGNSASELDRFRQRRVTELQSILTEHGYGILGPLGQPLSRIERIAERSMLGENDFLFCPLEEINEVIADVALHREVTHVVA